MRILPIFVCACFLMLSACTGSSSEGTLDDPASQGAEQASARQDKIEIPIGAPVARVIDALGPADSTDVTDNGREMWRYSYKRAGYVYTSNAGGVQTLVIGNYIAQPAAESPGNTLLLTIVFDPAKKVADYNFTLLSY